ncbi:elongation factor G, partial [Klebsiella pneumoniae]
MIRDRLGANPLVLQLPIGIESDFKGVIDLLRNRAIIWKNEDLGAEFYYDEIPADLRETAAEYRTKLVETAVEMDEAALEAYLDGV